MKGRALILIFLFLISLQIVSADVNGTFGGYVSSSRDLTQSYGSIGVWTGDYQLELNHDSGGIPDSYKISDIQADNKTNWSATATNAGDPFYIYYSADGTTKTELVGYGSISVHKNSDAGSGVFNVDVTFWFDNITIDSELSGRQYYILDGAWSTIYSYYDNMHRETVGAVFDNYYNANYAHVGPAGGIDCDQVLSRKTPGNTNHEYSSLGYFRNDYNIENQGSGFDIDITRTGFETAPELTSSRVLMTYADTGETYYESSFSAVNTSHYLLNGSFNYYITRQIDSAQYLIYTSEAGDDGQDHTATITFNESYYVKPDRVNVSWDGSDFNFTYNEYWVTVMGSQDGASNWQYIDYDYEPEISSDEEDGNRSVALYYNSFNLPFYIKAMIYSYNYQTGDTTILDTSDIILYSYTGSQRGSIWTDKSSYNISEIVTVTYTSYADNIKIRAYQHGSITTYWYNDLPSGTDNTIKITFDEKDRGSWDLRLIENDVFTNWTSITITSGDTPYVKWYRSVYDQGQIAPYRIGGSGGLMLYSTDVNATLSIFDAASTEIYNFSVGSGNNNMQINFAESAAPGMWTASLLNLGVRYNDTTKVTSTSSLISFNSSVYVTGDTIGINYFIPSSDYRIMLLDANFKEIIIFTTQNGVLSTGTYQTIPFSLVDNNEYGFNMIAAIDAGSYTTGYWEVWVVDQYGTFLDNGTVWDRAKVSKSSGDSADTSYEMISIFFSPEGVFMLFTVCLTMMGLVLAKHPAGGGAGAVVGVGFGVYFNVLPVWILMLTVILLVVMAGVSIAVYYKGK